MVISGTGSFLEEYFQGCGYPSPLDILPEGGYRPPDMGGLEYHGIWQYASYWNAFLYSNKCHSPGVKTIPIPTESKDLLFV